MEQLDLFQTPNVSLTVSELTKHIRSLMESDQILQDVWVQAEVSNLSLPKSGHMYFTLKDGQASLRCVMWRNAVAQLTYVPTDGDNIEVHGSVSVYEASGQYQLYADTIRPAGEGELFAQFQRLKEILDAEGLFDTERKRPIPVWPERIGIVTSPTGAALRDMLNTLRRRFPLVEVVLAPATVQGNNAPAEIVSAIQRLNLVANPDVILVARGGGSIEDLWAFNDENVARAIAASQAPVISGVGHETDFTIADFTADLRAPTPTAAAELAVPDQIDIQASLQSTIQDLASLLSYHLSMHRNALGSTNDKLMYNSPLSTIRRDRQTLDQQIQRIELNFVHNKEMLSASLSGLTQRLSTLNPAGVLSRGYAYVSDENGLGVKSIAAVTKGDPLNIAVSDGSFAVEVKSK